MRWRKGHVLLTAEGWCEALAESGFGDTVALATEDGVFARQGVIVAQKGVSEEALSTGEQWLVLGGETGDAALEEGVVRGLEAEGGEVVWVRDGGMGLERVGERLRGVVDLRPLGGGSTSGWLGRRPATDGGEGGGSTGGWLGRRPATGSKERDGGGREKEMMAAVRGSSEPVLDLVQGLAARSDLRPQVTLVTRGAVGEGVDTMAGVAQAGLWGLRRTIGLEHPEWGAQVVDVGGVGTELTTTAILTELLNGDKEDEVWWGADGRRVSRLVSKQMAAEPVDVAADGCYLVTGGLGGLGLLVGEWLVEQGARHVALLGRSRASTAAQEVITRLEGSGAQVDVYQADVTDREEMTQVLGQIERPLRGVIHAAGALDDGILIQQSWERFETVLGAKVVGSWLLHELTAEMSLDFFVLFSSTVGTFGNAGQGNHATANGVLPALAAYRRGLGLPALCIDWGAWADVGAAAARQMTVHGATLIEPQAGLRMLAAALGQAESRVVAVPLVVADLPDRPLFAGIRAGSGETEKDTSQEGAFLARWEESVVSKRPQLLQAEVQTQLTAVLGLDSADWLDGEAGFFEMGMDSLTAVEFRNRLQGRLGRPLPTTLAFDYPHVASLADYLWGEMGGEEVSESEGDAGFYGSVARSGDRPQVGESRDVSELAELEEMMGEDGLAELDEAELAALLDEELAGLGE